MKEYNAKNPKRKGYYFGDGTVEFKQAYPSVTTILKVLSKDALMFWYARKAVEVALDDPSSSVKDILSKTALVTKEGATRGTGVHNLFPKIIRGEGYTPYPPAYEGYIAGILKFLKDMKPKILMSDTIVFSDTHGFAGSLDAVIELNGRKVLIDLKTGNTYPEHRLQLSAYKQALHEMGYEVDDTAILLLKGDGMYQYILTNEPIQSFLNVKTVWHWWKGEGNE